MCDSGENSPLLCQCGLQQERREEEGREEEVSAAFQVMRPHLCSPQIDLATSPDWADRQRDRETDPVQWRWVPQPTDGLRNPQADADTGFALSRYLLTLKTAN